MKSLTIRTMRRKKQKNAEASEDEDDGEEKDDDRKDEKDAGDKDDEDEIDKLIGEYVDNAVEAMATQIDKEEAAAAATQPAVSKPNETKPDTAATQLVKRGRGRPKK